MIRRSFHSLQARLVLLILLALLPVLVVALINARQNRRDADRDVRRGAESAARLASSGVEQRLEAARQLLTAFSSEREILAVSPAGCRRRLARELRDIAAYLNFGVVDRHGRLVCTGAAPTRRGVSLARANWFRDVVTTGRPALGDDLAGGLAGRPALVVANPLRQPDGKVAGAVFALLDLNDIRPIVSSIDLPVGGTVTAFEPDGRILARFPPSARYVGRRLPGAGIVRAGRVQATGTRVTTGLDGVRRVYGLHRVTVGATRDVVIAVGLSQPRAQTAADRTLRRTLVTLLLVALAAVALVLAVANWFVVRPLRALARASRRIAAGDLHARSGVPASAGEVGELAAAFDDMAATLDGRQRLIDRSTGERQRLLAELVSAEEEERKRIAGDIHDDSIQALGALLLRLELIEARMEEGEGRATLAEAREAARESVARLRHMVFKLSPPALETSGLVPALELFVDEVSRVWGPVGSVESDLGTEPSPELRALVYRIASEAVNNAAKHAKAEAISVAVRSRDGGVWVQVADDGVGFDVDVARRGQPGHIGLVSMRERAESAGGWWRLTSEPGKGTSVEFWMPDRGDDEAPEPVPASDPEAAT